MAKTTGLIDAQGNPLRASAGRRPVARYLRDTRSGVISSRMVSLTESRDDIRVAWQRSAALALDLIKNSGRLRGAADQVIADTVGSGLQMTPTPDFSGFGWSGDQVRDWVRLVRRRWNRYRKDKAEVDFRGKFDLSQQVDVALRWDMSFGEVTGILEYMPRSDRRRYGIETGTKLCLTPPNRLVQDTNEAEGLFQGVYHDENGRPVGYLFEERSAGITVKQIYAARDGDGRDKVLHVFDPMDVTDVRGISVLASAFKKHIQAEMLDDATLQTAILQTVFAATLTSEKPTVEAFEALQILEDNQVATASAYAGEYIGYLKGSLEAAAESDIRLGGDPMVSHLAPGEQLDLKTAGTPGTQYLPFSNALARDTARAIGISYGALTMDHSNATYSSVRMENSSIWPVVLRRRNRCAVPVERAVYESWLDEEIGEGRIPFPGGYAAFRANRKAIAQASWQGPPKPTADDLKSAKASGEKLANKTSSIEREAAELGVDPDELFEQQLSEHKRFEDAGMASPYASQQASPVVAPESTEEAGEEPAAA
jgi:lambda family phage portal protein